MDESIKERVIQVFRRVLGPDADLANTRLDLESLKMLEIVVTLENEFALYIPEDAPVAEITASVDNSVRFLERLGR
jgi:acyl carrier protein